jgi:hypothetical protein
LGPPSLRLTSTISLRADFMTTSLTARAGLFFTALLTSIAGATTLGAQPNPYQRVEAPSPPSHLNDGR